MHAFNIQGWLGHVFWTAHSLLLLPFFDCTPLVGILSSKRWILFIRLVPHVQLFLRLVQVGKLTYVLILAACSVFGTASAHLVETMLQSGFQFETMFRLTVFCMPGASACRPEHLGSLIAKRRKMEVAASSFPAVVLLNSWVSKSAKDVVNATKILQQTSVYVLSVKFRCCLFSSSL